MKDEHTTENVVTEAPTSGTTATPLADRKYVDDRDLAKLTPISRDQWQAMRYAKEGPPWRKIGRRVVYAWTDVVAWIEAQPSSGAGADVPSASRKA